ncbi:LysR family transcriptional regulator, nitrogen assimilation regulatory protein [Mesorhizobium albiziae]|uniref:LysR family transcriptional regulator, nitrogen assimilation regulatory protein n=1 Tax=Neomesorhizobium albiziae TaxID=335020 RepID=A0A1I4G2E6_9HYPH|nr:LysR substrate-binding domain-containing protein [Mesorhizobium albiziae]GLS32317.1 LysR family transcriptional regulator [Mesorhizobium albiziae]SFL23181.1 LysR family transcriptional regulator, nitrogen assimilation regulatory protein [Mesorhizobium albiziae]
MQLRHLRYFVSIVDAGSFTRAAATIYVAQPALSQQIADLEAGLGVTLLHRSVRGISPTQVGKIFYREAVSVLQRIDQLRDVVRSTQGEPEGSVGLGMSSALAASLAGPLVGACRTALPKVTLRLVTGDFLRIRSLIESHALDIGTVFEDKPTGGVVRKPLFRQRLYLILPDNGEDVAPSVSLEELTALPLVLPARPHTIRNVLDRTFGAAGVTPNCVAEVDTCCSALSLVKAGIACAIVPKGNVSVIPGYEGLRTVVIDPPIQLTACLISSGDMPLTSAAEAVSALVAAQVERHFRSASR